MDLTFRASGTAARSSPHTLPRPNFPEEPTFARQLRLLRLDRVERAVCINDGGGTREPPRARLEFAYDAQSRRVRKVVKNFSPSTQTFEVTSDTRYVYDGWNLIAELEMNQQSQIPHLKASYAWGLDLSGTEQGAGGVGGLVLAALYSTTQTTASNSQPPPTSLLAPSYDGNGNILAWLDCASGQVVARQKYDPFGNVILQEQAPSVAGRLSFGFSTKYTDAETGWCYYGYRYYSPEMGRWVSRDPVSEAGFQMIERLDLKFPEPEGDITPCLFVGNNSSNWCDVIGLTNYQVLFSLITFDPDGKKAYGAHFGAGSAASREKAEREVFSDLGKAIANAENKMKELVTLDKDDSISIKSSKTTDDIAKLCRKADYAFLIAHDRDQGPEGFTVDPIRKGWPKDKRLTAKELKRQFAGKLVAVCGCNPRQGPLDMTSVINQVSAEIRKLEDGGR